MSTVYYQSRTAEVYGITAALLSVATFAVILRLFARRLSKARFWTDDWSILAALVFYYGFIACLWVQTAGGGLGRHTEAAGGPVGHKASVTFFKAFMAKQILYFSTSVAFKTSLILLYYRIFGLVRWFRYVLILAEAIVACYFLACFFAAVFECNPVSYYWDKSIPGGSCIKGTQFYRWNGVANLLIDLMILSITFPMVWGLSISLRQKATLSGVFALGMFVFIASILRVTSFEQLRVTDQTYTGVAPALWSSAEQSLGIVCACLPCLRPLFGRVLSDDDDDDGASDSRSTPLSRLGARKPQTGPGSQGSGAGGGGGGRTTVEGFARLPDDGFVRSGSAFSARVEAGPLTRQVEVGPEEIWKSQSIETRFDAVCLD